PFYLPDGHARGNGNRVDADAGQGSKPDQWSTAWSRGGDRVRVWLGQVWTSDQYQTFLSGHRNFSAALHGPGEHLFVPRICRGRTVTEQRIPSSSYREVF